MAEAGTASPADEAEERLAWRTAVVIMGSLSIVASGVLLLELLGFGLSKFLGFASGLLSGSEFIAAFVYIPTVVLLVGWITARKKGAAHAGA